MRQTVLGGSQHPGVAVTLYVVAFVDGPKTLGRVVQLLPEQAQVGLGAVGSMPAQLVI